MGGKRTHYFLSNVMIDIDKKDNLGSDTQVDLIRQFVTNEFVFGTNAATIAEKWGVFQMTFSERATEYMMEWMNKRLLLQLLLVNFKYGAHLCFILYVCLCLY